MTVKQIESHSLIQHQAALAHYLPGGRVFSTKNMPGEVLHDLLKGLAYELARQEVTVQELQEQFFPDGAIEFLPDWERALGIPDRCFSGTGTTAERQRDVLVKLASLGVQTATDFENLAAVFGLTVEVFAGNDYDPGLPLDGRFHIVVEYTNTDGSFTYTFPIVFGGSNGVTLSCLFNQLCPANCVVLFIEV